MKSVIYIVISLFMINYIYAQPERPGRFRGGQPHERIEELHKLKLIEVLNMDETTTLKFFARRNQHRDRMQALEEEGRLLLERMEDVIKKNEEGDLDNLIDAYQQNENKIHKERGEFLNSLEDLLSKDQIASFLVFEQRFREQIRDIILKDRRQRKN